ncbi:MAG: peptidoglycan-binding protein [Symploca sp. SIO2G7]|nr:peptidoglycan-binding protein [Symploca sp. SIO2G7]
MEHLDHILATAESDPLLSFLLDEADHMLAHLRNFIDDGDIFYQQQQLQTRLNSAWFSQAFADLTYRLQTSQRKSLQHYLKQAGFYQGSIDGVMGQATRSAMKQCCNQQEQLPQLSPINTPDPIA